MPHNTLYVSYSSQRLRLMSNFGATHVHCNPGIHFIRLVPKQGAMQLCE